MPVKRRRVDTPVPGMRQPQAARRPARVPGEQMPPAEVREPEEEQPPAAVPEEIPEILADPRTGRRYKRGSFLGRGGFGKCFEVSDMETQELLACKIVPKSRLREPALELKMSSEIAIHRSLEHPHVVRFVGSFEDQHFVYVLLELCRRRSLLELHQRRKAVTQAEAQYYMRQIITGCQYLHRNRVIHRDLKLGNIFLNDNMEVKIGDFGLATKIEFDGDLQNTVCGTPNYIAPEVFGGKGHSFEVDIWSLGCILYTLLVGKPPFETSCIEETFMLIERNEYNIPTHLNIVAGELISKMLQSDPKTRPTIDELLTDDFFMSGYIPVRLPSTCLSVPPRLSIAPKSIETSRKPLATLNKGPESPMVEKQVVSEKDDGVITEPSDCYLSEMFQQLTSVNATKPSERLIMWQEEAEDPACNPIFWVSKWHERTDGFGYYLCDDSAGLLFNDRTCLIRHNDGETLQYIEQKNAESYLNVRSRPTVLTRKIELLEYFSNTMSEHLLKAGANITPREGDELARVPYLRDLFHTRIAILFHLSNGTVQINFKDHAKIILCPLMAAVTFIDAKQDFRTYKLSLIGKHGCCEELASRLRYACTVVKKVQEKRSGSACAKPSA